VTLAVFASIGVIAFRRFRVPTVQPIQNLGVAT
jgi:hypothetical protein